MDAREDHKRNPDQFSMLNKVIHKSKIDKLN